MKLYKEYDKQSIRDLIESDRKRDLHMHTVYSDGTLTPKEVIDMRIAEGYELLSITDHDGMEGSYIGMQYAEELSIAYISGIEFDTEDTLGKDIHMLGYGYDYENDAFRNTIYEIIDNRDQRNYKMMRALNDMGYDIKVEDYLNVNEGRYVGKPTFAYILVSKGAVRDINEAFTTIFRQEPLKSITKQTMSSERAIEVIHSSGGVAVMAHPMEQRKNSESFADFKPRMYGILDKMRSYGVDGIECTHPSASQMQSELLKEYAYKYDLIITEGSDFHFPDHTRDYSRYHRD